MAKKEFLVNLFHSHAADLNCVRPDRENMFVCPICLRLFSESDIYNGNLTDGHVWSRYLRGRSKIARRQRVLLCHRCNHTAGKRGDKHMQLMEQVREGDESGHLFGARRIELIATPGKKPIELRATVEKKTETGMTITGLWTQSSPEERTRFENLANKSEPFAVIVHPHHQLRADLTEAGWITSAYLLAFYALGYRYILHESLSSVRECILKSFDESDDETHERAVSGEFDVRGMDDCYFIHPELALAIPPDGKTWVSLQVRFLDYRIYLPFHFVPSVLRKFVREQIPNLHKTLSELVESDSYLCMPIRCTKFGGHDCIYDYIMGCPLPSDTIEESPWP